MQEGWWPPELQYAEGVGWLAMHSAAGTALPDTNHAKRASCFCTHPSMLLESQVCGDLWMSRKQSCVG